MDIIQHCKTLPWPDKNRTSQGVGVVLHYGGYHHFSPIFLLLFFFYYYYSAQQWIGILLTLPFWKVKKLPEIFTWRDIFVNFCLPSMHQFEWFKWVQNNTVGICRGARDSTISIFYRHNSGFCIYPLFCLSNAFSSFWSHQ